MIKKTLKLFYNLICLVFIATLSSCTHSFYAPNDNIMVQLKEKNDLVANGSFSSQTNVFQVGYSPLKHLAIAGSHYSLTDQNSNDGGINNFQDGRFNMWKASIGTYYFINLGDIRNKRTGNKEERVYSPIEPIGFLFDLYTGYGGGRVENNYVSGGQSIFQHQQYFIQGGFHFISSFVDVGFSARRSILNFYDGKLFGQVTGRDLDDINQLIAGNRYSPTEFTFKVAGGWKYGKAFFLYNFAPNLDPNLLQDGPNLSVGLQVHINEIIQSTKKGK